MNENDELQDSIQKAVKQLDRVTTELGIAWAVAGIEMVALLAMLIFLGGRL